MKKLLALVLALVMTLGLATVSSSAAYSDANDIEYTEAADVMTAVGVFQGKGDAFAPKDNLNRAEAAKLIAYLMLGNKTAESIKGLGNKFTDVPASHWAAGYIEYLATAGVVSGVGNNQFDPNGQVTATQFAKMLLVALGYDATLEGFVGESWSINIAKLANDNDLFDGLDILGSAALTREQAAQMCLNDLKADTVDYESKGTTISLSDGVKATVDAKKSEAKTTTATKGNAIDGDDARGTTADPYTLQLGEDLYNGDLKLESTRDDFGRPANKWTYKNVEIDTYVDKSDLKAEYTAEIKRGPMYDLLGSSVYDHLVLGSGAKEYATLSYYEDGVGGVVNGSATAATNKTAVEKFVQKNGDKAINAGDSTGNGTLTQVFVDSDDNVTITVTNTYIFQASSDYRASSEDLVVAQPSGATAIALDSTRLELEDFPEIKDLKKDDYILVTAHRANAGAVYSVDSIAKAELLTATVDKYVGKDSVTLNGETKKYSKMTDATSKDTDYSVGQETTVVLDKYGYIIYVDEAVVANNYVFVSELYQANGSATSSVKANAYFTDGTNAEITIKEISGLNKTKAELAGDQASGTNAYGTMSVDKDNHGDLYAGWYTYNKNSSGEYTLNALSGSEKEYASYAVGANTTSLTKSDAVKFISGGTAFAADAFYRVMTSSATDPKADDKTIVVVTYAENNDVDVYTGVKNIPEINLTGATGKANIFSVVNSSNYAKYVFVTLEGSYTVFGTESESLLYIIELDKKNVISTDTTYYTYKALDENAKEIKVEADGSAIFNTKYTAYYKTSKNTDGRYTRGQVVPNSTSGTAKYLNLTGKKDTIDANNGTLSIAGDNFTLANGYKLVVVSKVDALNKLIKNNTGYEANIMTAEGLEAMVQGYSVTYNVQAKLDDTYTTGRGGKLLEAYVTITNATPTNAVVTPVVSGDDAAVPAPSYDNVTNTITMYYYKTLPTRNQVIAEMKAYLGTDVTNYNQATGKIVSGGAIYDFDLKEVVAVKINNVIVGYVVVGDRVGNTITINGVTAGNYIKKGELNVDGTDPTKFFAVSGTGVLTDASITAVTKTDIEFVSGYSVALTGTNYGNSGKTKHVMYTETASFDTAVTTGHYFPANTQIKVTIDDPQSYLKFYNSDNKTDANLVLNDGIYYANTEAVNKNASATYTVTKNIVVEISKPLYKVTIAGTDVNGLYADDDEIPFTSFAKQGAYAKVDGLAANNSYNTNGILKYSDAVTNGHVLTTAASATAGEVSYNGDTTNALYKVKNTDATKGNITLEPVVSVTAIAAVADTNVPKDVTVELYFGDPTVAANKVAIDTNHDYLAYDTSKDLTLKIITGATGFKTADNANVVVTLATLTGASTNIAGTTGSVTTAYTTSIAPATTPSPAYDATTGTLTFYDGGDDSTPVEYDAGVFSIQLGKLGSGASANKDLTIAFGSGCTNSQTGTH